MASYINVHKIIFTKIIIIIYSSRIQSTYLGCFIDTAVRALPNFDISNGGMTRDTCFAHCASNNQRYAGLQYAIECFCGDSDDDYAIYGPASESDCSTPCSGNPAEICGGGWRLSVFELGKV